MSGIDKQWWQQFGAMIGGIAAVATIHALVVVPGILSAAEARAHEIAAIEVDGVRSELRSRVVTTDALHTTFVTHSEIDQISLRITEIHDQLNRIETRLTR